MMGREYKSLVTLRNGETLHLEKEGVKVCMIHGEIEVGDWYVAERNTGPHLLTAKEIVRDESFVGGYIIPKEFPAYPFDLPECVRVQLVDTEL